MNILEKFIRLLQTPMLTPSEGYKSFHIAFLVLTIILAVLGVIFFRNASDKKFRQIVLFTWIVVLVLEILKQLTISFNYNADTNDGYWKYDWMYFPYQFCSTPLYVLPLIAFLKDGKVRDCFIAFSGIYAFFAGVAVMLYPGDVFGFQWELINHQTMIHHGSQVVFGALAIAYKRDKINIMYFLRAVPVFIALSIPAFILNETIINIYNGTFNMWFISRHFPCSIPILANIKEVVPYLVFLIVYFVGFSIAGFAINAASFGTIKLCKKLSRN